MVEAIIPEHAVVLHPVGRDLECFADDLAGVPAWRGGSGWQLQVIFDEFVVCPRTESRVANRDEVRSNRVDGWADIYGFVFGKTKFLLQGDKRIVETDDTQRIGHSGRLLVFGAETGINSLAKLKFLQGVHLKFLFDSTMRRWSRRLH
ncbi:MAG: hypothetical protein ACXW3B_17000 [Telluria sp.]